MYFAQRLNADRQKKTTTFEKGKTTLNQPHPKPLKKKHSSILKYFGVPPAPTSQPFQNPNKTPIPCSAS